MGTKRVRQEDIAGALGVSRITVSKALNGSNNISSSMREKVLEKAEEMGYTKYINGLTENPQADRHVNTIRLMTYMYCVTDSYWAPIISGMASSLAGHGYDLSLCFLSMIDSENFMYPNNFDVSNTAGIILLGNFTYRHVCKIKRLGIPIISIDTVCEYDEVGLLADTIMSCNKQPMALVTARLIAQGHRKIGYLGQNHLNLTFKERFNGFCLAMKRAGIPLRPEYCVLVESGESLDEKRLSRRLSQLPSLPTAFVCANDETAILLIQFLKASGVKAPGQIAVSGFDNLKEAEVLELTTVNVCKTQLGMRAAEEMIWRIQNPDRPYEMIRVMAEPIFRRSTELILSPIPAGSCAE